MEEPIALVFEDKSKLVKGFSEYFLKLLNLKKGSFSIALSGGSTPKVWFEYLVNNHKDDVDWNRVHLYWGDERCVPPDNIDSNYGMTKGYLLDHIAIPNKNIHRMMGEVAPGEAAEQYSKLLLDSLGVEGVPIFDLVILGLGEDGHTASIFPHQIDLWESDEVCVVATHTTSGQQRISITGKVINNAGSVAFLVTGEGKKERVKEIIDEEPHAAYFPASLVKPVHGSLHWFLDAPAATFINDDL